MTTLKPDDRPTEAESPKPPRQYSIRSLFVLTTIVSVVYCLLNLFGAMAHIFVWAMFLIGGPVLGVIIEIKKLKEPEPIINSTQAGALGGGVGFIIAMTLLAPANSDRTASFLATVAFSGTIGAFTAGGCLGFMIGVLRALLPTPRRHKLKQQRNDSMPVRTLAIIAILLAVTFGIILLAWISGSELYLFCPGNNAGFGIALPPTSHIWLFALLFIAVNLSLWSPHYALVAFTIIGLGIPLGTVIGWGVFQWTPSVCQCLLTASIIATLWYCWKNREYLDY